MNKTKMKIKDVTSLSGFTLSVDVYNQDTLTTETITLSNVASALESIIAQKYNHRYFYYTGSQPSTTPTTAFLGCWTDYKIRKQESINAVYTALVYSHYNPTENVFEYSHTKNEYDEVHTEVSGGKTEVKAEYGARHSESKASETSFENATDNGLLPTAKQTNDSNQASDTTTSEQKAPGTSHTNDRTDVVTMTRHGNVGTIDSMSMIQKELNGRHLSFYNWLADDFINEYTYYSSRDEVDE